MNKMLPGNFIGKLLVAAVVLAGFVSSWAQSNTQALSATDTSTNPPAHPRHPPILLIIADNVGFGDLGCYGQTKIKTPNLDKLASDGIRFTSYYAGSPNDEASRASLFTGLEPRHVGASFSHPLPMDAFTVAAMLKEKGYTTGLVGEWNLGDTPPVQPAAKGFDEFVGFLSRQHAVDYFTESIFRQEASTGSNQVSTLQRNWNNAHGQYVPDFLGEIANNFININRPYYLNHYAGFFLCVSYPIPHDVTPPQDTTYAVESWPQPEKDRAAMITHMDASIGSILDELVKHKADTNTVVIFTSIGGAQKEGAMDTKFFNSSGPLRGEAGSVYEGGIRVPMIIRWPARIKPGQVSDFKWAAWDFLPTAADIALIKPPEKTDGNSIMPVLMGRGKAKAHESFYWSTGSTNVDEAVRVGDWKLVQIGTNAPALYDLKKDIGETNDVAGKNAATVKKLKGLLVEGTKE
jgi:arylsulfatase A-like enzyme